MQLNEVDESRIRLEIRNTLLEFFQKPSEIIDQNLGTNVSYEYKYPEGITKEQLQKTFDGDTWNMDNDEEMYNIHRLANNLTKKIIKINPELASLGNYAREEYWSIFMGIISGYNPDDILFFIQHPGGYSNPKLKKYSKEVLKTFDKFPFNYDGGYLPSPKSFQKIKEIMKGKGLIESSNI
jgi:hypothetical protein